MRLERELCETNIWFRDLDSNQDTQLQRLMSYRLDDPGSVANTTFNIMPQPLSDGQRIREARCFGVSCGLVER
jgi:hypothetical protein